MFTDILDGIGALSGGSDPASAGTGTQNYTGGAISVCPSSVNLGEILQAFAQTGGPETGGYSYTPLSRLAPTVTSEGTPTNAQKMAVGLTNMATDNIMSLVTNPLVMGVALMSLLLITRR